MVGNIVVEIMEVLGIEEEVEEDRDAVSMDMIHWLVTKVGCIAIWPMNIPVTELW